MNKIYLIGGDVSRSKSYLIHNAIYEFLGLNLEYELVSLPTRLQAIDFVKSHLNDPFFASNITFPYKKIIKDYAYSLNADVSLSSKFADGSNLIISPNLSLLNYDGQGLICFLKMHTISIKNANVVICGTGATSMSICAAFLNEGVSKINILSRTASRIERFCESNKYLNNQKINFYTYKDSEKFLHDADILVDACPKDKYKSTWVDGSINLKNIKKSACIVDVLYKDANMPIERLAKDYNLKFFDGKGMLVSQAVLCIQEIAKRLHCKNKDLNNFRKLYTIGSQAIGFEIGV